MQALDLNLASRPFKNNTLLWAGFSLAAFLLGVVSVDNVVTWKSRVRALRELEGKVGGIETRQQDLTRRAAEARREIERYDTDTLFMRTAKANEVIRWKSFSWTRLFNQLEEVQPWDVQMAAIHPAFRPESETSGREVREAGGVPVVVEGTARGLQGFLDFERALIKSPYFMRVEPSRTEVDTQTREIVFGLRFIYDPGLRPGPPPALEAATDSAAEPEPVPEQAASPAPAEIAEAAVEPPRVHRNRGKTPPAGEGQ